MKEWKNEKLGIYTFDISFQDDKNLVLLDDHNLGDLIKLPEYENINIEFFQKQRGYDCMFIFDSDIVNS